MSDWVTATLSEICRFDRGLTYSKGDEVEADGIPVLRANNINLATNTLDLSDVRYISSDVLVPDSKRTKEGALLICTASGSKSHLGKVAYIDSAIGWAFGGFMGQISAKPSIVPRYLYYLLSSASFREHLGKRSDGVNINNLKFSDIADFNVPLPSLAEQKRIVEILDEAFEGIAKATANAERNLSNARELFAAILRSAFANQSAWYSFSLGERVKFIDYRGKTPPKTESGIRLITAKNVKMGFVQRNPEEFIDPEAYVGWMTRGFPRQGDVLFTTEAPLGNIAQLDTDETVVIGQRLITMQPEEEFITTDFLKWLMMSPETQSAIWKLATGATVQGIKAKLLKTIPLAAPELSIQRDISDRLEDAWTACGLLERKYNQKIAELSALKAALLYKAFSGQLTGKEVIAA